MASQLFIINNPVLCLADFTNLKLTFNESSELHIYSIRYAELSRLAVLAEKDGNFSKAKALRVLADVCCMWWSDSYSVFSTNFEQINNSFDDATHDAIAEFCKTNGLDFWLQARLAEFAYLRNKNLNFANIAIQAYARAPLTWKAWYNGGSAFWLRALELEGIQGITPFEPSIKSRLLEAVFNPLDRTNYRFIAQLATSFYKLKIAVSREELTNLSAALDSSAISLLDEMSDHQAGELYALLARWHQQCQHAVDHAQFSYKAAKAYIQAANAHPDSGAAARIYESAIASLEAIPNKHRGSWNDCSQLKYPVETLTTRLKRIITQEKQLGLDGMQKINFGFRFEKNIFVEEAKHIIVGASLPNDLKALANAMPLPSLDLMYAQAKEHLAKSITPHLGPQLILTSTGNISAAVPPTSSSDRTVDSPALHKAKVDAFCNEASFLTGVLNEALAMIEAAHPNATAADFELYCKTNCAAIPANQLQQWGVALFAGYKRDWIVAIYLIAPLLESLIRNVFLLNTGQRYTIKNKDSSDNEPSLNTLLQKSELKTALGEDLIFAIDALFCNGLGPNFRNQVAHGLLTDERCKTSLIAYAWWLVFSLASLLKNEQRRQAEISA